MALATRCPHCHTTFKVAQDQLKLRAGLVRCGACKQIFNGIEHLLRLDDTPSAAVPAPSTSSTPAATPTAVPAEPLAAADAGEPAAENSQTDTDVTRAPEEGIPASEQAIGPADEVGGSESNPPATPATQPSAQEIDPLQRMTLMDFTHVDTRPGTGDAHTSVPTYDPNAPDPLERAINELQSRPLRGARRGATATGYDEAEDEYADAEEDEPSFVRQGRRRQRMGRTLRIAMMLGSVVLLIAFLAQALMAFRNDIAARFPETKTALSKVCRLLGCQVGLLTQSDAVSIESSELQAVTPEQGVFAFTLLLRNHSTTLQAWPYLELVLNDANEKPIARRVFTPREYLAQGQNPDSGFAPKSEQAVKLRFEMSQLKASGYRVYLFYP